MQCTVQKLTNGFSVVGGEFGAMESHYASTLSEAVFWVSEILKYEPPLAPPAMKEEKPVTMSEAVNDPLMSQRVVVYPLTGGGYMSRAEPNPVYRTFMIEEYCVDMDAVHDALTKVYTYVPTP